MERKWQQRWEERGSFRPGRVDAPRVYHYAAGPFTNGRLHMGHVRTFVLADVMARVARQRDVLYSFEFDAFGLPTELAAKERGVAPPKLVEQAVERMRADLTRLGLSVDWEHVPVSSTPRYYRWTQWLFLRLHDAGLIYKGTALLNYCTTCESTLAHIQVVDGLCWRCDMPVERREMTQWFVRLSAASERLLDTMAGLDGWSSTVRRLLAGFIGRVDGFEADVTVESSSHGSAQLTAFVPREEWTGSARAVLVAPGHPEVARLLRTHAAEADTLVNTAALRRRRVEQRRSGGELVDTGLRAAHPEWPEPLPVLASDAMDPAFGTGVTLLINDGGGAPLPSTQRKAVHHRVQDWLVSRQRSWGTPLPVIECSACGDVPVPDHQLPLLLEFAPDGTRLVRSHACPRCGGTAQPVPDTIDCFFDAIWAPLATASLLPDDAGELFRQTGPWQPMAWFHNGLDSFIYAHLHRFLGYALHGLGLLDEPEPIRNYHGHSLVQLDGRKMSKHHGNTVDASTMLDDLGADRLRTAVMWAANPLQSVEWGDEATDRATQLLATVHRLVTGNLALIERGRRAAHVDDVRVDVRKAQTWTRRCASRVGALLDDYRPCAALNELSRLVQHVRNLRRRLDDGAPALEAAFAEGVVTALQLLAPFAPHLAEELWEAISEAAAPLAEGGWPAAVEANGAAPLAAASAV
jgi:leucyl-tRNA synthetase